MKRILILHEFGKDIAIDISSQESYETVALAIVNVRFNDRTYSTPQPPIAPELPIKKAKELPAGKVRDYALTLWNQHRDELKKYQQAQEWFDSVKKCLEDKDGKVAIRILGDRHEYDGEGFAIFTVEETYPS